MIKSSLNFTFWKFLEHSVLYQYLVDFLTFIYSDKLRNLMCAEAIILSPVSCQTWKSCTANMPSIFSNKFLCKTSTSICLGTVCSRMRAESISRGHTPRSMMHTMIRLRAEKKNEKKKISIFWPIVIIFNHDDTVEWETSIHFFFFFKRLWEFFKRWQKTEEMPKWELFCASVNSCPNGFCHLLKS